MKDLFDNITARIPEGENLFSSMLLDNLLMALPSPPLPGEKITLDITEEQYQQLRGVVLQVLSGLAEIDAERKSRWIEGRGHIPYTEYYVILFRELAETFARRWNAVASERRENFAGKIHTLSIDIETYSSNDLSSSGVYKYAEADDFEILLFAYAINGGQVEIVDLAQGETLPMNVRNAITDPAVTKTAFNAMFERVCLSRYLDVDLQPEGWECTMVRCAMLGLPMSLDTVGKVLNLEEQKMDEGKTLIRYFSLPCKPTKTNGNRTRNRPQDAPDKWAMFKRYCIRDVEVENAIRDKTASFRVPLMEKEMYIFDQRINDRGVMVDLPMVTNAIRMSVVHTGRLMAEAAQITGLDNPNSVTQLKGWLEDETGNAVESLNKKNMPDIMKSATGGHVQRLLAIRKELGKTSVKKYEAMEKTVCSDSRVRGLLQFHGASRTGRWAGRLVQVQNLPQNHFGKTSDLELARNIVLDGDLDTLEMLYGNVPDTLSQLIRTAFVAKTGHVFVVSDFSSIEARVIAWLAGERWRLDVFATHGKIYEASASMMFKVPVEDITKTDPRRQKGKIAELALGYQGGVNALKTMGGEAMGLSEVEMKNIVDMWREANVAIVSLWDEVQQAATACITGQREVKIRKHITFRYEMGAMTIQLPHSRKLFYPRARIERHEKFGRMSNAIVYEGQNQTTRRWEDMETYGGKLVENIVQAIARDCLAVTIGRLEMKGYPIVFHVHDEIVAEMPEDVAEKSLEDILTVFREPLSWADELPLKGDGYITKYYLKD